MRSKFKLLCLTLTTNPSIQATEEVLLRIFDLEYLPSLMNFFYFRRNRFYWHWFLAFLSISFLFHWLDLALCHTLNTHFPRQLIHLLPSSSLCLPSVVNRTMPPFFILIHNLGCRSVLWIQSLAILSQRGANLECLCVWIAHKLHAILVYHLEK